MSTSGNLSLFSGLLLEVHLVNSIVRSHSQDTPDTCLAPNQFCLVNASGPNYQLALGSSALPKVVVTPNPPLRFSDHHLAVSGTTVAPVDCPNFSHPNTSVEDAQQKLRKTYFAAYGPAVLSIVRYFTAQSHVHLVTSHVSIVHLATSHVLIVM